MLVFLLTLLSVYAAPLARAVGVTPAGQPTICDPDLLGNLRTVQRPAPAALISYGVDGLNRRISKSVGGSIQRAWAYDGARVVAEINGATFLTWRFVYGTRPQVPDYMIQAKSGEVYRILTDHLGSVRLVVRLSDGAIVQELAYDPWGAVEKDTTPGFQPFGFAGGLYDPDTRLVRFGARDYDPTIGRWTAKDPSGFAGGTNLYAYASNDPVNQIDLTGENPVFFLLAGAMRGIAEDLFFQMVIQGKRTGCVDGTELAIAGIMGALSGGLGAPAASGAPRAYSVAFETTIPKVGAGSRGAHFKAANEALLAEMKASPSMASTIEGSGSRLRQAAPARPCSVRSAPRPRGDPRKLVSTLGEGRLVERRLALPSLGMVVRMVSALLNTSENATSRALKTTR